MQLLSISDWHAQFDPFSATISDGGTTNVSGAGVLAAYFAAERTSQPNTIVVTGGDAWGGSPALASFFNEEPAVIALGLMGVQVDTFGNHNFDRGVPHLQQMVYLARDAGNPTFVSSNLNNLSGNLAAVATPFHIVELDGVKIGFVGITNEDAPSLVFPGRFGNITVAAAASSANSAITAAKAAGAKAVIVLVHMGATLRQSDGGFRGPLLDFASQVNGAALIAGDHTDILVNTVVNGTPVVENLSKGRTYARVRFFVDRVTGQVSGTTVQMVDAISAPATPPSDGGTSALGASATAAYRAVEAMLAPYRAQLKAQMDTKIAVATEEFVHTTTLVRTRELPVGDLVADALRSRYGTDIALVNSGGIRSGLPSSYPPSDPTLRRKTNDAGAPYDIVVGDAYEVLRFQNLTTTRTVTGAQIWQALEHGVSLAPTSSGRFPQISGLKFTYRVTDAGTRVQTVELADGGAVPNNTTSSFTMATLDFVNAGGDGYTMFADGMGTSLDNSAEVLTNHIRDAGVLTPTDAGRIVVVP